MMFKWLFQQNWESNAEFCAGMIFLALGLRHHPSSEILTSGGDLM